MLFAPTKTISSSFLKLSSGTTKFKRFKLRDNLSKMNLTRIATSSEKINPL